MRSNRDRGDRGIAGERGPKGDHGQVGERGKTGNTGEAGADGIPYLGRKQTLFLFGFVVLAFVLLAARTEINARHIKQGVYQDCLTRAVANSQHPDCGRFR